MKEKTLLYCRRIVLMLVIGFPLISGAQVMLGVNLPASKVLLDESIRIQISIKNTSANLLSFGADENSARLSFHIEDAPGRVVRPFSDDLILLGVDIMPGETRSFDVSLSSLYEIRSTRKYKISAMIEFRQVSYISPHVWLDVVRGVEILKTSVGIPGYDNAMRSYILEYIERDKAEYLYLKILDEREDKIYGVHNLGRLVRVRKPILRTDEPGNVHVLFETVDKNLIHIVYTPYGEQLFSTHIPAGREGWAALRRHPDGRLTVATDSYQDVLPLSKDGGPGQ